MDTNLVDFLPSYFANNVEMLNLMRVEDSLFDELNRHMRGILYNQFILTCDLQTIEFWEGVLNIDFDPVNDTEQFRRERIINRFSSRPPFTMIWLRNRLDQLIGAENYEMSLDTDAFRLSVESDIVNYARFREMIITINRVKPANIVFTMIPLLKDKVYANPEARVATLEFMRAGTWEIGITDFETITDERRVRIIANNQRLKPHGKHHLRRYR